MRKDPNLQNIPVRTPEGRRVRAAFLNAGRSVSDPNAKCRDCGQLIPSGSGGSARREWVRDGGDRWYWGWSPSHCSKRDEVVIEDAWVADDDWLDRTKTTSWQRWHERVDDTSLDNGWVSPAGRLYRCAYWEHDALCYEYLRREVRDLENEGWCKLQRSSAMDRHNFVMARRFPGADGPDHRLTREQVQALLDAGFVPPIYMLEEAEGDWSELVEKLWAVELGGDNA